MTNSIDIKEAATPHEIQRIFDLQQAHQWTQRLSTADDRKSTLTRLRAAIDARTDDLIQALADDLGMPASFAAYEVSAVLTKIDDTISHLSGWMKPTPVDNPKVAASAHVRWESRGVVLLFSPWNVPVRLLFEPLVAIIAAGNTAIVKPNEVAPASSTIAAQIISEVFIEQHIAVVEGGIAIAQALLELPFDHIFLTGSPNVGRQVMAAAAKHLSSVTLELGGKCPTIIGADADFDSVVKQLTYGKMLNNGQICLSVDYVLVPNSRLDEFVEKFRASLQADFFEDGKYVFGRTSRVVNTANFRRLKALLDNATATGATVSFGGHVDEERLFIEPTILTNVNKDADVLSEEIFGPIVPVVGYDNLDEAIAHVQAGTRPLGLYVFSNDEKTIDRVISETSSGGVTVNGWGTHYLEDELPFGGVGTSGMGRYHGIDGFRELSHGRAVAFA